jgi:hypothetical protein
VGRAKFALAVVTSLVLIAQSAAAKLVIDDFEDGAFMFADRGGAVVPPVLTDPEGSDSTSKEQSGLTHVLGGVRLATLRASQLQVMTAGLVRIVAADNGVGIAWTSRGSAWLTYDGSAGGLAAAGSAGALDLDLSSFDSIAIEASEVRHGTPDFGLSLSLSDSVQTLSASRPIATGANVFPLSDFTGIDLAHVHQIQVELWNGAGLGDVDSAASARILDISAVSASSPGSGLPAPSLLAPASGATVPSTVSPQFTWSPVTGATGYRIAVMEYPGLLPEDPAAPGCAGCAISATAAAPAYTQLSGLPGGRVYRWRVQALPAGRWSDPALFTTAGSVALQITSPLPGSVIGAETVEVRGIVTPPAGLEVGVQVNGSLALVGAGKFGAAVRVDDTVKVLEATARDASGAMIARHAIPISVTTPIADPAVGFSADPDMGTAPFTVHSASAVAYRWP